MTLGMIPLAGLRERKKQLTRATIARVALDLFHEQGFHDTTIAQIAEAANVSPRTVSAYFPAKEDLVFPDQDTTFAGLGARLAERQADETTADALRNWLATQLPSWQARADEMRKQRELVETDAGLLAYQQGFMLAGEQLVAESIARDLDASPDDLEPRMAAAATFAIFTVLGEHRSSVTGGDECAAPFEDADEAMALLERALRFVDGGIRALRGSVEPIP